MTLSVALPPGSAAKPSAISATIAKLRAAFMALQGSPRAAAPWPVARGPRARPPAGGRAWRAAGGPRARARRRARRTRPAIPPLGNRARRRERDHERAEHQPVYDEHGERVARQIPQQETDRPV